MSILWNRTSNTEWSLQIILMCTADIISGAETIVAFRNLEEIGRIQYDKFIKSRLRVPWWWEDFIYYHKYKYKVFNQPLPRKNSITILKMNQLKMIVHYSHDWSQHTNFAKLIKRFLDKWNKNVKSKCDALILDD